MRDVEEEDFSNVAALQGSDSEDIMKLFLLYYIYILMMITDEKRQMPCAAACTPLL